MYKILVLIFNLYLLFPGTQFAEGSIMKDNVEFVNSMKGLKISAVAPGGSITAAKIEDLKNIDYLNIFLNENDFDPKVPLHSNTDYKRFLSLKNALLSPDTNVIWNIRGGYGSAKLIPMLAKMKKPNKEKFFIGYSDITVLHLFLTQKWGWKTIHGPMLIDISKDDRDRNSFLKLSKILSGEVKNVFLDGLIPLNNKARRSSKIRGTVTGGNLTIVETSIGTEWQIDAKSKILFLEDVNIYPYMIDRSLLHLQQSGIFDQVEAIIFGDFSPNHEKTMDVLKDFAHNIGVPVFYTNKFGHGVINDPIVYNVPSYITTDEADSFTLIMNLQNQGEPYD